MSNVFSATFQNISVSAVQDVFEINAPSTRSVIILSAHVGQLTDTTDATAEHLRLNWQRSTGSSGSGGGTITPALLQGSGSAGSTVERNNTTQATTLTLLESHVWNTLAGWFYNPVPEERIIVNASARLVLSLPAAPSAAINVCGYIRFMEA